MVRNRTLLHSGGFQKKIELVWLFWPISVTSKWCNRNLDSEEHCVAGSPCKNISGVMSSEKWLRTIQVRVTMCWHELLRTVSAESHHSKGTMVLQAYTKLRVTRDCFCMEKWVVSTSSVWSSSRTIKQKRVAHWVSRLWEQNCMCAEGFQNITKGPFFLTTLSPVQSLP